MTETLWSVTTLSCLRSTDAVVAAGATRYRVSYWRPHQGLRWQVAGTLSLSLSAGEAKQAADTAIGHANRVSATIGSRGRRDDSSKNQIRSKRVSPLMYNQDRTRTTHLT